MSWRELSSQLRLGGDEQVPSVLMLGEQTEDFRKAWMYLAARGYIVHKASRMEDACRILTESCIDIVLLDSLMPDWNLPSLLESIHESRRRTAIVVRASLANEHGDIVPDGKYFSLTACSELVTLLDGRRPKLEDEGNSEDER